VTGAEWTHTTLAVFFGLGALLTISTVGKERKPTTGGVAALTVLVQALIIFALLYWWPE
jgi:hypothetical protein